MRARLLIATFAVCAAAGVFLAGRASVRSTPARTAQQSYHAGLLAGRDAAFCCYDGGWGLGEPYIVVLRRGGAGVTYRIAQRWPMAPGLEYRICGRAICAGAGEQPERALP
jgi:hypothetical protein